MRNGFWIIAAVVVVLDQWTKHLVQGHLPLNGESVPLLPGLLALTHVHNPGVAFGQLRGAGPVLVLLSGLAILFILGYRAHVLGRGGALHPILGVGLSLALGGAVGNLLDRARLGIVVDFLDILVPLPLVGRWPVFNIADTAITLSFVALASYFLFLAEAAEPHRREDPAPAREYGNEPGA